MSLAQRMIDAANTIAQLNAQYDLGPNTPWEPETLRHEAEIVASEPRLRLV